MNLPICAVTGFLVATCLDLKVPKGTLREKLLRLDWMYVLVSFSRLFALHYMVPFESGMTVLTSFLIDVLYDALATLHMKYVY